MKWAVVLLFVVAVITTVFRWFQIHRDIGKRGASVHVVCGWYFWVALVTGLYIQGN